MIDRVLRAFTAEDLEKITGTFQRWKRDCRAGAPPVGASCRAGASPAGEERQAERLPYKDLPGFCKSATLEEIAAHGFVLTPGRYVGAEEQEDDGEPVEEKMTRLVAELNGQFAESAKLEATIKSRLASLGYGS